MVPSKPTQPLIPEISVVIPIYKNQEELEELTQRLMAHLKEYPFEIVYVNDASPDDSLAVLEQLEKVHPAIKVVDLKANVGQQKATLEGLKVAKGKKVAVMDGDLQDTPELLKPLLTLAGSTNSAAYVLREGAYQSRSRMLTSRIIKYAVYLLSGLHYKAGSYYLTDQSVIRKAIPVAAACQHPYLSIIVAHFTDQLHYHPAQRVKSFGASGYTFFGRLHAAFKAIYCSLYCSYVKLVRARR